MKKDNVLIKSFAWIMAGIIFCFSMPLRSFADNNPFSYYDVLSNNQTIQSEYLGGGLIVEASVQYCVIDALEDVDVGWTVNKYIAWQDVANFLNDNSGAGNLTNSELNVLCSYLDWGFNYMHDHSELLETCFSKMGYYPKDVDVWFDVLKLHPEYVPYLINEHCKLYDRNNELIDDKYYSVSSEFVRLVKLVADEQLEKQDDELYIEIDTLTFQEYFDYVDSLALNDYMYGRSPDGSNDVKARIQDIYDFFSHDDYPYFFHLSISTNNGYRTASDVSCWVCTVPLYYYNQNSYMACYSIESPDYAIKRSYGNSRYVYEGTNASSSNVSSIGTGWVSQVVTIDGRVIKIYKSLELYDNLHDWSNGSPYDSIVSNQYGNYVANGFVVSGDYANHYNSSTSYTDIVNNTVEGDDYSGAVINNYYVYNSPSEVTVPTPNENGDGDDGLITLVGQGIYDLIKDYMPTIIHAVLDWIAGGMVGSITDIVLNLLPDAVGNAVGDYLPSVIDWIIRNYTDGTVSPSPSPGTEIVQYSADGFLQELNDVGEIVPTFTQKLSNFMNFPRDYTNFMRATMEWIPQEWIDLALLGMAGITVVTLIKALRG